MFHEIGSSRFVHLEESETTRSNPVTFARQARITLLSAAPRVVATAARILQLMRQPLGLRLLRGRMRGEFAQILLGLFPVALVALDPSRHSVRSFDCRITLFAQCGALGVTARTTG
jgi:hypothetical protein